MPLLLDVPYSEKDEAKALGARWNQDLKKWYVPNKSNYPTFKKWILQGKEYSTIICDHFYIVTSKNQCFKCHKETTVVGFGIENYYEITEDTSFENGKTHWYYSKEIHIASQLSPLPDKLLKFMNYKYNYFKSYSKTTDSEYFANHCTNCNIIQGNFFLFEEVDSPFCIDSKEAAANLKLYKIPLHFDLILDAECGYGSEDYLISKYGHFECLNRSNIILPV